MAASKAIGFLNFKFGADLSGFERAMKKSQKSLNKFGRNVKKTGKTLSTSLTLPIAAIGAASGKLSMDFDTAMTKITTLVGVADNKVQAMKESVLELAGETAQAPVDLAEGLYFLTSAGLRGANAMETLEAVAKASASGLGDMESLSRTAAAAQNAYGVDTLKAADALDIFGGMVKSGMFKAEELSSVLGPQLGLAAELGVSFEQVGAFISTYTKTTGDAAAATTGLGGILMSFAKITPQMEQALTDTGMSVEGLRTQLSEEGLQATLIQMQEKFQAAGVDLSEFFSKSSALKGVLGVLGNQTQTYVEILDDLAQAQGFVDTAFERTAEGPGFQMKKAFNSLKVAGTELGDTLAPVITLIAAKIVKLTKWFRELSAEQKNNIVKWAGILALLGPVLYILGSMATVFGSLIGVIGFFTKAIKTATSVQHFFNLVLKANPIGIIITVIAAVVAAIVYFANSTSKVAVTVRNVFATMVNGIIWYINILIKRFNWVSEKLGGPIIETIEKIEKETYKAADSVDDLGDATEEAARKVSLLEGINNKAAKATEEERTQVELLSSILKDGETPRENQIKALKELKKISPEYFGDLKIGISNTNDITTATNNYTAAILKQAQVLAIKDKIEETVKNKLEARIKMEKEHKQSRFRESSFEEFEEMIRTTDFSFSEKAAKEMFGEKKFTSLLEQETWTERDSRQWYKEQWDAYWRNQNIIFHKLKKDLPEEYDRRITEYTNMVKGMDLSSILFTKPGGPGPGGPGPGEKKLLKDDGELTPFEIDLAALEENHTLALTELKETQLIEQKSADDFNKILENKEIMHLVKMKGLYKIYGEDVVDLDEEIVDKLLANQEKLSEDPFENYRNSLGKLGETIAEFTGTDIKNLEEGLASIVEKLSDNLAQGAESFEEYGKNVLGVLREIIGGLISKGVASAIGGALEKIGAFGPLGITMIPIVAGVAAGLARTAFNSLIPEFEHGGLVTGPTTALIGEQSTGANPEVIAPLDKLKSMIGGGQNITVQGRLVGNDIYLSNERTKFNRNRTV